MLPVIRAAAFWIESRARCAISGGGLHLRMTQQLPNHRKALAERERPRGEAVSLIPNSK